MIHVKRAWARQLHVAEILASLDDTQQVPSPAATLLVLLGSSLSLEIAIGLKFLL